MSLRAALREIHQLEVDGVVARFAIGGAVALSFHWEPVTTLDVDVFVALVPRAGELLVSLDPIITYFAAKGYTMEGEYIRIQDWPVQILAPPTPLVEEALLNACEMSFETETTRVFGLEYLAAIALQLGRAKDKARLLQLLEVPQLDRAKLANIVERHGLDAKWSHFVQTFLEA